MRPRKRPKPLSSKKEPAGQKALRPINPDAENVVIRAGFPEFWQSAHSAYPLFFDSAFGLMSVVNQFLRKPVRGKLPKVLHFMMGSVANSFGALITLALNGYGQDAMTIARGIFEMAVNMAYLKLNPNELEDYLDFHWIRKGTRLDYLKTYAPASLETVAEGDMTKLLAEIARVKPRFENAKGTVRGQWCKQSIRKRAELVGLGQYYLTFYADASEFNHGGIGALSSLFSAESLQLETAPSLAELDGALRIGHLMVLNAMTAFNDAASLGMSVELQSVYRSYQSAWPAQEV